MHDVRRTTVALKGFAVTSAFALAAMPAAGSTWWNANGDGVSWSDGANWNSGTPPPVNDAAKFEHQGAGKYLFRLTPPADYVGTIIVDDEIDGSGGLHRFPITLELTVLDGAEWTVEGPGTIIATDGIAERLKSSFTGVIEIPAGRSFAAPATLSAAVRFVGAGDLTLTTAAQVANAAGFAGTIHLPADVSPTALSVLQNADLALPDGGTLTLSQSLVGHTGIESLPGFAAAGAWSFNGTRFATRPVFAPEGTDYEYSALPPYATANGDLALVDDPGQTHSAFLDRRFKLSDDWGVSFTWVPELPSDSRWRAAGWGQTWSGYFGFYLQNCSVHNVLMPDNGQSSSIMTTNSYGFTIYAYRDGGEQCFEWVGRMSYAYRDGVRETALDGIVFTEPVDFEISCRGGVLVANMRQNGKSASFREDLSGVLDLAGDGVYIGFAGASDNWPETSSTTVPWMKHTISNFKGWCTTRYTAGWRELDNQSQFSVFNSRNWLMASVFEGVTNRDDAAEINADGSFQIVPASNFAGGIATCRRVIDVSKPVKVSFDYKFGAAPGAPGANLGSAEGVEFGFQRLGLDDPALSSPYNRWTGKYDAGISEWGQGWGFNYGFWNTGRIEMRRKYSTAFNHNSPFTHLQDTHSGALVPRPHSTAHFDVVYDAKGSLLVHGVNTPDNPALPVEETEVVHTTSAEVLAEFKAAMENRCRITFAGFSGVSDNDLYQETAIRNLTVSELVDNAAPELACALSVPAGATATVEMESVKDDGASPTASVETLSLGDGATLNISPISASGVAVLEARRIETVGAATVSAAAGATLRVGEYAPSGAWDAPLAVAGAVEFPSQLVVRVPGVWGRKPTGVIRLFNLAAATPAALPQSVLLLDSAGNPPPKEYKARISAAAVDLEFIEQGTLILFR